MKYDPCRFGHIFTWGSSTTGDGPHDDLLCLCGKTKYGNSKTKPVDFSAVVRMEWINMAEALPKFQIGEYNRCISSAKMWKKASEE